MCAGHRTLRSMKLTVQEDWNRAMLLPPLAAPAPLLGPPPRGEAAAATKVDPRDASDHEADDDDRAEAESGRARSGASAMVNE